MRFTIPSVIMLSLIHILSEKYTDFYFELLPEIELDMEELEELQEKQEKQQMENKNGREDK